MKSRMAAKKPKTALAKRSAAGSAPAKRSASTKKTAAGKKAARKGVPKKAPVAPSKPTVKAPKASKKRQATPTVTAARKSSARTRPAAAAAPTGELLPGSKAPAFELLDQDGRAVSSKDLAGQAYVIYFYPKDDTPGCTTQACAFRDAGTGFEGTGVRVIGVSPDSSQSHKKFENKYELPFTLLSDPDHELCSAYGVWAMKKNYGREYMGVVRSTFLVAPDGSVAKAWRGVRVAGHVDEVLVAARGLP
jgi:peroxiredoxin Q/BCP